jgi:hypothetical protein
MNRLRGPLLRERLRWGPLVILGLLVAALGGAYSVGHPQRALAFGGVVVIGLILLDLNARRGTLADRFRWIAWAWLALLLVTDLRLVDADPLSVTAGTAGLQHIVQLGTYAAVMALVLRARRSLLPLDPRPVPKGVLLAWPAFAVLSAAWSLAPIYTLVRASQLLVIGALILLVVRIWMLDRAAGAEIFTRSLRLFVQAVTVLAIIGLATGSEVSSRFTWPGMHPGVAATALGAAFLALVVGGRSRLGFPAWTYWPRVGLFGVTLFMAQTRSVIAGVVVGIGVALWFKGRDKPIARYLGVTYYVVGGVMLVALATTHLFTYLSRGESPEMIATFTGRTDLWDYGIAQLDSMREWFLGLGYGTSRIVLLEGFEWGGSAHSTWMELLLGIGLVGLALAVVSIAALAFWLARRRSFDTSNLVALSILAFFLMTSPISEGLAVPGIGFGFLALVHIPALGKRAETPAPGRLAPGRAAARAG